MSYESMNGPEVVCLCGSTRFKREFENENRRLTLEGKIVLSVGLFGHHEPIPLNRETKDMLDDLHEWKIALSDRVHVINVGGYLGESTKREVGYAWSMEVPVTFLEQDSAPSREEMEELARISMVGT